MRSAAAARVTRRCGGWCWCKQCRRLSRRYYPTPNGQASGGGGGRSHGAVFGDAENETNWVVSATASGATCPCLMTEAEGGRCSAGQRYFEEGRSVGLRHCGGDERCLGGVISAACDV